MRISPATLPYLKSGTKKRAFTIIEVLLAIGIFMLILASIYSVWHTILRGSQAARSAADSAQRTRISMRALQDALTTAQMFNANMPPQNPDAYYAFIADMSGDYGSISFVAHLPATFPGVGRFGDNVVRRVTFNVRRGKEGNELWVEQGPMLHSMDQDYEPYSLLLAKNVTMFGFEFWGINPKTGKWEWLEEWNSTNSLPALVHVGLGLGKTAHGDTADVAHRYIALPANAVQPDWQMPVNFGGGRPGGPGGPNTGVQKLPMGGVPQGGVGTSIIK
jgi:type II secretory pathway pseudopilin PulG